MKDSKQKREKKREIDPVTVVAIIIAILFIPLFVAGFFP
ncbi:putative membrane protein [Lyngbya aestuarii BL J]|uniref:Putative membrane protein n=1 Tax=Lyngbya aestuarii BL J TaxID=1348334 RepID=U7QCU6_9CYAN|nr:putative membrane protein [Lyngbya aestuarii BL J]